MNVQRSVICVTLTLVLLVSSGCSLGSFGKRSGKSVKAPSSEVSALRAQIVELQRRAAVSEVEIGRLQKRLAELESTSGQAAVSSRSQPASPLVRAPAQVQPESPAPVLGSGRARLEVSDLPAEPEISAPRGETGVKPDVVDPDSTLTASAQALYDRGYTLFHRGHYVDSETAFQQFLSRYGATVLGDNAQFWIGEARYARGDVAGARTAYLETASRFPNGNKAPDALLKAGDCSLELGDREAARQSFRALVEQFPGSAASSAARERIAQLP